MCPGGFWAYFLTFLARDGPLEWVRPIPKAPERSWHASGRDVFCRDKTDVSAAVICPVSTADICPVSTEDIYPVSTEDITAAGRRPAAVASSVETG